MARSEVSSHILTILGLVPDNGGAGGQAFGGNNSNQAQNNTPAPAPRTGGTFGGQGVSIGGTSNENQLYTNYDHLDQPAKNDEFLGQEVEDDENPEAQF